MSQLGLRLLALCCVTLVSCVERPVTNPDGSVPLEDGGSASGDDGGSSSGDDGGSASGDDGGSSSGDDGGSASDAGASATLVALDAQLTVVEDGQGMGQLAATSDAGLPFTFALHQPPAHGTATVANDGSYTYAPAADFAGQDRFVFRVGDGASLSTAAVTVTVTPVNDAPGVTAQRALSTPEEVALTVTLADLTVTDVDDTSGFTFTLGAGSHYTVSGATVTPAVDFNGTLTVPVTVTDGAGASSAPFPLSITVTPVNDPPLIVTQAALTTAEDTALTLSLSDLTVADLDDAYPTGFTLTLGAGTTYTVNGATVTPGTDFSGTLSVPVTVTDAAGAASMPFSLVITVTPVNDAPVITAPTTMLSTAEDTSRTIALTDLAFTDVDSSTGFTLQVAAGINYTVSGTTVTPAADFNGTLTIPVTVRDAAGATSSPYGLALVVTPVNDAPVITAQSGVSTAEDTARAIALGDLQVTDVDDPYPAGFTLVVGDGTNYTRTGAVITPAANFNGTLFVPVSVRDAAGAASNTFSLGVTVTAVNDAPLVTGQGVVSLAEDTTRTLTLSDVTYTDIDTTTGFTLSVGGGANYTVSGTTITPAANFFGTLTIPVTVSDGVNSSAAYNLTATVTPVNDAPLITGQATLSFAEDTSRTITASDLTISDPDSSTFTVSLTAGANYTVSGTTITPAANFFGTLSVPVSVSDGVAASNTLTLTLTVTPVNDPPVITGQSAVTLNEDTSRTITTADLTISDVDSTSFTVSVLAGTSYTFSGASFTPAADFNGALTVNVRVSDGAASSSTFALAVTVTPVNDAPRVTADTYSTNGNTLLTTTTSVLTNDTDVEGSPLAVSTYSVTSSRGGTVTMATNGTFTFLPAAGDVGVSDTFTYVASDGSGGTTTGTVTVNVVAPRVWFVDAAAATAGDGRSSSPSRLLTTPVGLSGPGDYFFVKAGAYTANVTLQANQRLVGGPAGLSLPTSNFSIAGAGSRPVITAANAATPVVTLATGAQVNDVNLTTTTAGTAVSATSTSGNTVQRVQVTTARVAFQLTAVTGLLIDAVTSASLADSVLVVPDGSFVDGLTLSNSTFTGVGDAAGDRALNFGTGYLTGVGPIRNTVTLRNVTISSSGQDGIWVEAAGHTGTLVLDAVTLSAPNNGGHGLVVRADAVNGAPPTLTLVVRNNSTITVGPSGDAINAAAEGSGAATLTVDVQDSTLRGSTGLQGDDGLRVTADGLNSRADVKLLFSTLSFLNGRSVAVGASANGAVLQARVEGNTLSNPGALNTGVLVETMTTASSAQVVAAVRGNTISSGTGGALVARGRSALLPGGRLDLEVTNNSLTSPALTVAALDVSPAASTTAFLCAAIGGNTALGAATAPASLGEPTGTTTQLEGTAASASAQLSAANTNFATGAVDVGVSLVPVNTCRRPTN
jgi:hypothetical protein